MKRILIYIIVLTAAAYPQATDPDKILAKLVDKFNKVENYEVDVKIKVDLDFIKMPDSQAKIYFKQPDKIRIKSEKFAMLPKEGLDFSPASLLKGQYTALYKGEESLDNIKVSVVKIIPLEDRGDIILTTLWIDQKQNIIRRIETSTKLAGTFIILLKYDNKVTSYPLPSFMVFSFNAESLNLPKGMAGQTAEPDPKQEGKKSGKVLLTYSNYKVNKGIPDSIFEGE